MNTEPKLFEKLKDKEYRGAFVASQINMGLPFQIRALRESRGWSQGKLATVAGMKQPRISAMERPGGGKLNLDTLRRLAAAFDVALIVRFVPFSELVDWVNRLSEKSLQVPSFEEELRISRKKEIANRFTAKLPRFCAAQFEPEKSAGAELTGFRVNRVYGAMSLATQTLASQGSR